MSLISFHLCSTISDYGKHFQLGVNIPLLNIIIAKINLCFSKYWYKKYNLTFTIRDPNARLSFVFSISKVGMVIKSKDLVLVSDLSHKLNNVHDTIKVVSSNQDCFLLYGLFNPILQSAFLSFIDGETLRFLGQKIGMKARSDIIRALTPDDSGLVQTCQYGSFAHLWNRFRHVYYIIAASLMFVSLIMKCIERRDGLSYLMTRVAFTLAVIGVLIDMYIQLPPEYVFAGVPILIVLAIIAAVYRHLPDRADPRMIGP